MDLVLSFGLQTKLGSARMLGVELMSSPEITTGWCQPVSSKCREKASKNTGNNVTSPKMWIYT